jgi:Kef-type K+ transport system membrane component KefB
VDQHLFPPDRSVPLAGLASISALMVLAVTGFHTDPKLVHRWSRRVPALAIASLVIPFAAGAVLGGALPVAYRGPAATTGVFVLFMAIALSISSPPVISRVLADAGQLRRDFAQVTLAVAMTNDVAGWILLGVVISLAGTGELPVADLVLAMGSIVLLAVLAVRWGPRVVGTLLAWSRRYGPTHGPVAAALVVIFAVSAFTNAVGIEAVPSTGWVGGLGGAGR